jgi:hypothetical protein
LLQESNKNLDEVVALAKELQVIFETKGMMII